MGYFIYDGIPTPLKSFDLYIEGRNPYTLEFSGAVRPMIIYKIIDDVYRKGEFNKPYVVGRVECNRGGFSYLNLRYCVSEFDIFTFQRKITPESLEFNKHQVINVPDEVRENICILHNKSIYSHWEEIRGIVSIDITFKGKEKILYLKFGNNYKDKYHGDDIDHIKIVSPSIDGGKIIGVLEFALKFEREYEGEYMFTITDILDIQY